MFQSEIERNKINNIQKTIKKNPLMEASRRRGLKTPKGHWFIFHLGSLKIVANRDYQDLST